MPKVWMVIANYFPLWGGTQRQLKELAAALKTRGVDNFVITRGVKGSAGNDMVDGVTVVRIYVPGWGRFADSLCYIFGSFFWLLANRRRFDVLHCFQIFSPTTIGVLVKFFCPRVRVVVKVTSSNEFGEAAAVKKMPFLNVRRLLLKRVDLFFVVNERMRHELNDLGVADRLIELVPNGVTVPSRDAVESKRSARERLCIRAKKVVLFTGRFSREKNIDTLLYAWSSLGVSEANAQLILVGEGTKDRNIQGLIETLRLKLDIASTVQLAGKKDDITDYLAAADIFVNPSTSEGLSNSLLEAMAYALAVIAGDNDGNRQLVTHNRNGLLVKPRDVAELASAMRNLMENDSFARDLGTRACEKVSREYSMQMVVEAHLRGYGFRRNSD
jgi:glycosyltransferase involved in cell wall biosynthesis